MKRLPITIWRFEDAPEDLRSLSTNGGDEDWLAEVPSTFESLPIWMEHIMFGPIVDTYEHPTKSGWHVVIGSHS
jgi:hypothetical protein